MVVSKFCLLQVQFKFTFFNSVKLNQTMLCKTPKRLNSVDVLWTSNKLIIFMIDPKVLIKPEREQKSIKKLLQSLLTQAPQDLTER